MKKTLSLVLLLCICLTALIACAAPEGQDNTTTPSVTTPAGGTTPSGDGTTEIPPVTADLGGATIKTLAWETSLLEFEYDEDNVDQVGINEAFRTRNENITQNLSCELEFINQKGHYEYQQEYLQRAQSFANGDEGEFIDIYAAYSMSTALLSTKGLCKNLLPLQKEGGLNFKNPWWPQTMVDQAMFDNRLYVCTGDISANLLWMMEPMYFNKDMLVDLGHDINYLYDLTDNGEWTIDKFYEMCASTYDDTDADGVKSAGDTYGFAINTNIFFDTFYVSADFRMVSRNAEGKYVLADGWGGEVEDKFADRLSEFTLSKDYYFDAAANTVFTSGRALFTVNRSTFAKSARETAECDYGIIPMPKLNTAQANYSTNLGFGYGLYAISSSSTQPENAALALEAMASESYDLVTPALFYDALQLRYSPEVKDALTFDILKSNICFDAGRIYTTPLNNYSYSVFRGTINSASSHYSIKAGSLKSAISELIEQLMLDLSSNVD